MKFKQASIAVLAVLTFALVIVGAMIIDVPPMAAQGQQPQKPQPCTMENSRRYELTLANEQLRGDLITSNSERDAAKKELAELKASLAEKPK